ncbi:MAG: nitrous oxide-stimulated promoter family protein [Phycisphaerae bacterium]|nr:nitrous oxide-stimulated promoter family protein [Phycisphaerae bacterium]
MTYERDRMGREKRTIAAMVGIFCSGNHGSTGVLCGNCREMLDYALARLEKCPFGAEKGPCSKCEMHCYKPAMRDKVRLVMRYAGPRMLKKHPILAVKHLLYGRG